MNILRHFSVVLVLLTGLFSISVAQTPELWAWPIGFGQGSVKPADSSVWKLRSQYERLYRSGRLTIAIGLSGSDSLLQEARVQELKEVLWEGGIPPKNIVVKDLLKDDSAKVMHLNPRSCYLVFMNKERSFYQFAGTSAYLNAGRDTLIPAGDLGYWKYSWRDYRIKTDLPVVIWLSHDLNTLNKLGLYEKLNTRGFRREISFFQLMRNDSDNIPDPLLIPIQGHCYKSSLRLECFNRKDAAWMPVRDAVFTLELVGRQPCIAVGLKESGIYRVLAAHEQNAELRYFKAPKGMAFVSAEMEEDPFVRQTGDIVDGETGVLFMFYGEDNTRLCRFVLKDAKGRMLYLPEVDWQSLVHRKVKLSERNRYKYNSDGQTLTFPSYAYVLSADTHQLRTLTLETVK